MDESITQNYKIIGKCVILNNLVTWIIHYITNNK